MRDECHARDGKRSIVDSSGAHSRPFATSRSRSRSQHVNNRNQTHVDVTVHQEQGTRRCAPHTHMTQPGRWTINQHVGATSAVRNHHLLSIRPDRRNRLSSFVIEQATAIAGART